MAKTQQRTRKPYLADNAMNNVHAKTTLKLLRLLLVTLFFVGFVFTALAQDEEDESHEDEQPHRLEQVVLCVEPSPVVITFDKVQSTRAGTAKVKVLAAVKDILKSTLTASQTAVEFPKSCVGRDGSVLVLARVTFLDPAVYGRYGYKKQTFGLTISVQVGDYADKAYFTDHYVLPDIRFMAFDEIAHSEGERKTDFEQRLISQTKVMVEELARTWHEDNP